MAFETGVGTTPAERQLARLARKSFLTLWSYPNPHRDDGIPKELCDLLVVFGDDVVIFSDKDCAFPDSGNLQNDWARWYRRAIEKSARQLHGAERWLRAHPNRIFLDRNCANRLPFPLPDPSVLRVHLVLVAHGAAERCTRELAGSGSLMLTPGVVGDEHLTGLPFAVGVVNPGWGYMHVFDDTSLDIVLTTLDTTADFVAYLTHKEAFLATGKLAFAAGEEELLAEYLSRLGVDGEHDFVYDADADGIGVAEGFWYEFCKSPQRQAQIKANEVSYAWDALIEKFAHHIATGTQHWTTTTVMAESEQNVRWLARENRTRRRMLSASIHDLLFRTGADRFGVRVHQPSHIGDPYYVFLVAPGTWGASNDDYREKRREWLYKYCMAVKLKFADAQWIVGLATESGESGDRSEDLIGLDCSAWTADMQAEAEAMQAEYPVLERVVAFHSSVQEYPEVASPETVRRLSVHHGRSRKVGRNERCPCGSGMKYKRCCGR